jgi:hypothetical protein
VIDITRLAIQRMDAAQVTIDDDASDGGTADQ